jgi:hypothetical protein
MLTRAVEVDTTNLEDKTTDYIEFNISTFGSPDGGVAPAKTPRGQIRGG